MRQSIKSFLVYCLVFILSGCGSTLAVPTGPDTAGRALLHNSLETFAGVFWPTARTGGPATQVRLCAPQKPLFDPTGNLYFSDLCNYVIRKISLSTNNLYNVAGNGTYTYRIVSGPALQVGFSYVYAVARASNGDIYLANDTVVAKVSAATGFFSVVAGSTTVGGYSGDGGPANKAKVAGVTDIAIDSADNLYIADANNYVIRKIVLSTGIITTVAGINSSGFSGDGGLATAARISHPAGLAVDASNNVYISDLNNYRVRKITISTGKISSIAGNGTSGYSGDGGAATSAMLTPGGLAVDNSGNLLIADNNVHVIRKITGTNISTIAGNGTQGYTGDGGSAFLAQLDVPSGVAVDNSGNIYISDQNNNAVRVINGSTGIISTFSGGLAYPTVADVSSTTATNAYLANPQALAFNRKGDLYFSDSSLCAVFKIVKGSNVVTLVAGTGTCGYSGDGVPAVTSQLSSPYGIAFDPNDNLIIADTFNNRIRKVDKVTGIISTVAGNGTSAYSGDGGLATSASLNDPYGVAVDAQGNYYIADSNNRVVREVSAATRKISTLAGDNFYGYSGDGGPAAYSELSTIKSIAVDAAGNIYIGDDGNHVVRRISADTGYIDTFVGNGNYGDTGDGGLPANAELSGTAGMTVDSEGNFYVVDTSYNRVRKVSAATGRISTVIGSGVQGFSLDSTFTMDAKLAFPYGVAMDPDGYLYVSDSNNRMIRRFLP